MRKLTTLAGASAILMLTAATAIAAPCATGTAGKSAQDKSSNVDGGSTAKVTPGAKAESPGTVGAMNNVGATATSPADVQKQQEGKPTAAQQGADNC